MPGKPSINHDFAIPTQVTKSFACGTLAKSTNHLSGIVLFALVRSLRDGLPIILFYLEKKNLDSFLYTLHPF